MEMLETEVEARRPAKNEEFKKLADEHKRYEEQLEHIAERKPFTQQDWFEQHVVKKRKLQVKDRMATLQRTAQLATNGAG